MLKALEALSLIDSLFAVERQIIGASPKARQVVRREKSTPIVAELNAWMDEPLQELTISRHIVKTIPLVGGRRIG